MEVDSKLRDCLASLLHHGLQEEHNFAVGILDYVITYLESKFLLYPKQIYTFLEEEHKSEFLAAPEDGEIVSSEDDKPAVKEETIEEDHNNDTSHDATVDLTEKYKAEKFSLQKDTEESKLNELEEEKEKTTLGITAQADIDTKTG